MVTNPLKPQSIHVSVVMPCLNEQETIGICIEKVQRTLISLGIKGEVIIADNHSTDDSVAIAERFGTRVVHQKRRGYGAAYLAGFSAAQGEYIIMGDADDTYDFTDLERFTTPLHDGYDMVIDNRFKEGYAPKQCRGQIAILETLSCQGYCSCFSVLTSWIVIAGCVPSLRRHIRAWRYKLPVWSLLLKWLCVQSKKP